MDPMIKKIRDRLKEGERRMIKKIRDRLKGGEKMMIKRTSNRLKYGKRMMKARLTGSRTDCCSLMAVMVMTATHDVCSSPNITSRAHSGSRGAYNPASRIP
jgi:hypothetical protein